MYSRIFKFIKRKILKKFLLTIFWELKSFLINEIIKYKKFTKSKYGIYFKNNWLDVTFRFYIEASYGFFYWNRLKSVSKDFIFLDIGANQGLFSICAAQNPRCKKVYAFEPVKKTFLLLKKNIRHNKVEKKCLLFKKGIGLKKEKKLISINRFHSGSATLNQSNINKNYTFFNQEWIDLLDKKSLNSLFDESNDMMIYCKIDVEGFEESVIRTLISSKIISKVHEIYYEVDEEWIDSLVIKNLLKEAGFRKFIKNGKNKHYEILALRN